MQKLRGSSSNSSLKSPRSSSAPLALFRISSFVRHLGRFCRTPLLFLPSDFRCEHARPTTAVANFLNPALTGQVCSRLGGPRHSQSLDHRHKSWGLRWYTWGKSGSEGQRTFSAEKMSSNCVMSAYLRVCRNNSIIWRRYPIGFYLTMFFQFPYSILG